MLTNKHPGLTHQHQALAALLLALLALLCLVKFGSHIACTLQSSDSGWLIRTGQYIVEHGIPANDPFSWSSPLRPIVIYQWLYAVILGWLWQQGGLWLVGLATSIIAGLIYLWYLPASMISRGVSAVYTFAMLSLCCTPVLFWARPQITSFVLILAFGAILEHTRTNTSKKSLAALPLLMVLWANLHSFWFIGLGMVAAYLFEAAISKKTGSKALLLALFACLLAVLINPYGTGLIVYNLSFTTEPDFASIRELQPLLLTQAKSHLYELLYLALAWAAMIMGRRSVPLAGLLLSAITSAAALLLYRFGPVAMLITWPYVSMALASFPIFRSGENIGELEAQPKKLRHTLNIGLACLALISALFFYVQQFPQDKPVWFTNSDSSLKVTEFLKEHPALTKRLLCDPAVGSTLIYENIVPVFFDTRFDFYGRQFCTEFNNCFDAEDGWQQYIEKWQVDAVCVDDSYRIYKALLCSPAWQKIYDDKNFSVWLPILKQKTSAAKIEPVTVQEKPKFPSVNKRREADLDGH
ncbi:hypothetical protein BH11CYA1_BH11CYA1_03270 [soil metagenome]